MKFGLFSINMGVCLEPTIASAVAQLAERAAGRPATMLNVGPADGVGGSQEDAPAAR